MKKIKIICSFGTRPEAIKMCPLVLALKKEKKFTTKVILTAQHRNMLDQVMDLFHIKSDYDLNTMIDGQSLYHISTKVLNNVGEILKKEKPDILLVHGDTTTTLMTALAGYYEKISIGHVEAGLRSYDKYNPFPEEANRLLTDGISELLFAPTKSAKNNLLKENISPKKIFITGNTVIDSLLTCAKNQYKPKILDSINNEAKIILVTLHRRENWGKPLENICKALNDITKKEKSVHIIWPVHLNPKVWDTAHKILGNNKNIHLIKPVDYKELVAILKASYMVLTDSGGIQEEAPALGKPVLVARKVTERPEAVKAGTASIIGNEYSNVLNAVLNLINNPKTYNKMANAINPYGDGKASERIIHAIKWHFKLTNTLPKDFIPKI